MSKTKVSLLLSTCILTLSGFHVATADGSPSVLNFSPQGTIKEVRQVRVQFSEAMVPFGFLKQPLKPFQNSCAQKGKERWADEKNWLFDFEDQLPAGVKCKFTLESGIKTLSGKEVGGQKSFEFSTGGPSITNTHPWEGAQVAEDQVFVLTTDAPVDESSLLSGLTFNVKGISGRVGVKIITGSDRAKILKSEIGRDPGDTITLIQAKQNFPYKANVKLVWGKSIQSKSGVAGDQDQVIEFSVRDDFLATVRCDQENEKSDCIPLLPLRLSFTANITKEDAQQIVIKSGGKQWKPAISSDTESVLSYIEFKGPFPERSELQVILPSGLKDDAGRSLTNSSKFPLTIRTAGYPPLAKFAATFGILESKEGGLLPVTMRNVEAPMPVQAQTAPQIGMFGQQIKLGPENADQILYWMRKVNEQPRDKSLFEGMHSLTTSKLMLPRPNGKNSFEVIGIPLGGPGFYVIELESHILGNSLLGEDKPLYVPAAALVTNIAVHFKWGRESSLVWVTALDSGKPLKGAKVRIHDCSGQEIWAGNSDSEGLARPANVPNSDNVKSCNKRPFNSGLMVSAQLGDDLGLTHTEWNDGIESWRFNLPYGESRKPFLAHTVLARSLLRAGDTLNMKHIMRRHQGSGFSEVQQKDLPPRAFVTHEGSGQKFEFPLIWQTGASETTWKIPADAKLGEYSIKLGTSADSYSNFNTGSFQVEEFRIPSMRGLLKPPSESVVAARSFPIDLALTYLSGGAAGNANVRFRYAVREGGAPDFPDLDDFTFGNGTVKEGIVQADGEYNYEQQEQEAKTKINTQNVTLDKAGTARVSVSDLKQSEKLQHVEAEMEFRDPNGVVQTVSRTIPVYPSNSFIGIKPDSWIVTKDSLKFQTMVVDLKGKPVSGASVTVDAFVRKFYSHRKRLVGGYYAYDNSVETKKVAQVCSGTTDQRGLVFCQGKVNESGNLILAATSKDSKGNSIATNREVWVAGDDSWWFKPDEGDRMDLIPEKKHYEPGEVAKFQVRMPFSKATALVSIEREGIIERYVKELSGKQPVIEIPIKGNYAPNIFVSVMAMRGRAGDIKPTALIDLGKPSYRLGIAHVRVGQKAHELKVKVSTNSDVFRVRDKTTVKISARTMDDRPAAGAEVALAAVDEGLLELKPNNSWELLAAMMGERGYEIAHSTSQMQVVGRRHFGLKALPAGGGGGRQMTRELFDTLLTWKGRVTLDANGSATVEVPLNDSLTSFRIVAVATSGANFFGTGSTSIRTTQDLMVLPGIPPLIRQGDSFQTELTVRNTTTRQMDLELTGVIKAMPNNVSAPTLNPITVSLAPGEAKELGWQVSVPVGASGLTYEISALETSGGGAKERLKVTQKVIEAVPVRTFQATLEQIDKEFKLPIQKPTDSIPDRGGIYVEVTPTLIGSLETVREYMRAYPYTCMEQMTSKSIALRDPKMWETTMEKLPLYLDSEGFVKYFPEMRHGSETLTAYLLSISDEASYQLPPIAREKMLTALKNFVSGKVSREYPLQTADLAIRKLSAIEALSRYDEAQPEMLTSIQIQPNLWPTSAVLDYFNILKRVNVAGGQEKKTQVEQILRSRMSFQGTTLGFSTEAGDGMWWLMASTDVNSVRLMLATADQASWQSDMPRIARGVLQRRKKGHWDLTLANAWGVLALESFVKKFEKAAVTGNTSASIASDSASEKKVDWTKGSRSGTLGFSWPPGKDSLGIKHTGAGKPWALIQSKAAIPLKEKLSAGFKIEKSIKAIERKDSSKWTRGDLIRVTLKIKADADRTWVVVSDPIPGGASILGTGLARESNLMQEGEKREGYVWPAYEERSFEAFRSYYEYVPQGEWTIEYTLRLNQSGEFQLPQTRAEAMYSPEMFGEHPNETVRVSQ